MLTDCAVFLPKEKGLVIADLQLGYEQQLRALGHNIRYEQAERMLRLLQDTIKKLGVQRLIINGDLKHEFGRISGQERRDILGMLRKLRRDVDIVITKGNHDTITKPLATELGVPLVDEYLIGEFFCVHGHENRAIPRVARTIIIGHMHPAVLLHDGVRKEKYKCFLVGMHARKRIIVLPSFSSITEGADVLSVSPNTPLLTDAELQRAGVFVLADEIRPFGTVKKLNKILTSI